MFTTRLAGTKALRETSWRMWRWRSERRPRDIVFGLARAREWCACGCTVRLMRCARDGRRTCIYWWEVPPARWFASWFGAGRGLRLHYSFLVLKRPPLLWPGWGPWWVG